MQITLTPNQQKLFRQFLEEGDYIAHKFSFSEALEYSSGFDDSADILAIIKMDLIEPDCSAFKLTDKAINLASKLGWMPTGTITTEI